MSAGGLALAVDRGTFLAGTGLLALAALAWAGVLREASHMPAMMPAAAPSLAGATAFVASWGVMMTAMMLPSAAPMILLYRTVTRRLDAAGERAIPVWLFVAVYLIVWALLGVPVYTGYLATAWLAGRVAGFDAISPFLVAGVLGIAGAYQLSGAKRACLRYCESPLDLLMRRWRSGYAPTLRLALSHAAFCVGCCWGLMLILVAAGAMSLAWVLVISSAVFAEKVLPRGRHTARAIGVALILLGVLVAARPEVAAPLRGGGAMGGMEMGH